MSQVEKMIALSEAEQIQNLRDSGAISEEEYQQSISDLAYMLTGME